VKIAVSLACLGLLAGCGPLLSAELELPEVCQKLKGREFPGVPGGVVGTLSTALELDVGAKLPSDSAQAIEAEAQLLRLTVTPQDQLGRLDFIDSAQIELAAPRGSAQPPAMLVSYQRGASAVNALSLSGDRFDALPYLEEGKLRLKASITGALPAKAWNADVEACVYVRAVYAVVGEN
jgi:hypothetical protein